MELSNVLSKVRKLVALAEHPETPKAEADRARAMADDLMEKYAIQEWQTIKDAPKAIKPTRVKIDIGEAGTPFLSETAGLVNIIANFCRCSSVWMKGSGRKSYGSYEGREEYCYVYGYESDLRYFELLFTQIYLHMAGAVFPKPDPALTVAENAYVLHNAGLNWYDIAQAYGWHEVLSRPGEARYMYENKDGERAPWSKAVGVFKNAYAKEIKRLGETALRIPPTGSANFRANAVQGYIRRISQRLLEQQGKRSVGAELVLADRDHNIAAQIAEDFPEMGHSEANRVKFNAEAYRRGVEHANKASLAPEAGSASRTALS